MPFQLLPALAFTFCVVGCSDKNEPTTVETTKPKAGTQPSKEVSPIGANSNGKDQEDDWKLVWSDEFDGEKLNLENWTRQVMPNPYNGEWQQYVDRKENSYVKDGCLIIEAIHTGKEHGDNQYTSGRLHTGGKQEWMYGRIAARIQLPKGKGIWPAFWMLGANIAEIGGNVAWPKCGEIDILELYGSRDDGVVEANLHYDDGGHKMLGAKPFKLDKGIFADQFHVFEIQWDEEKIIWSVDGMTYCEADISGDDMSEFHHKFYILLNLAVGGEVAGPPDDTTPFPARMRVDWVRVFQRTL